MPTDRRQSPDFAEPRLRVDIEGDHPAPGPPRDFDNEWQVFIQLPGGTRKGEMLPDWAIRTGEQIEGQH